MSKLKCVLCGIELNRYNTKYCSNLCQRLNQRKVYIEKWLNGEISGTRGKVYKAISKHVMDYLKETFLHCSVCGISEWNGAAIVLEIDHIDGDSLNNSYENLRVICPNCHSQTTTYKGRNRGKSTRENRNRNIAPIA